MFDKLKQRLFPSEETVKALRTIHKQSVQMNVAAHEGLLAACEKGNVCPLVAPNRNISRRIG